MIHRPWQILSVNDMGGGLYSVLYLLGAKERRRVYVKDVFGLDYALTEMGKTLAAMEPFLRARVGIGNYKAN